MKLNLRFFLVLFTLFSFSLIHAQTSGIKGVVIEDKTGQPLPGATVTIVELNKSRVTDANGNFTFSKIAPGSYVVKVLALTFQEKEISEVVVVADEIYNLTISLLEKNNQLDEVVIKAPTKAKVESVKSLLTMQKNSATVSDGISAETIKRTPDKNTSDVLKRISGASIQDNRFVIIRGLNDRYNASLLNGSPLPSSESDRKAFSFDIFPSNMLDNIIINKTASPDLPGEFAGGVVQINTKSVPDKDFQSISVGSGYNTVTTFKEGKTYKGSPTDWLGFDNGTRDLPNALPGTGAFNSLSPTERSEIAKTFEYDWSINNETFKPNTSFQYSIGRNYDIKDKVFGFLFSATHNLSNNINEFVDSEFDESGTGAPSVIASNYEGANFSQQVLTSAIANFSFKFNQNNSLTFKNIFSINSRDLVVTRQGKEDVTDVGVFDEDIRWFTSNRIYSGQFGGEHYLPSSKIKIGWSAFYSDINRSIPNLRNNRYFTNDPDSTNPGDSTPNAVMQLNTGGTNYAGGIFFSELKENSSGGKFDISKKFTIGEDFTNEIKTGAFVQSRDRDFFARQLQYNQLEDNGDFNTSLLTLPNETIFNVENMGVLSPGVNGSPQVNGFTLFELSKLSDAYKAGSQLYAGYLMLDNRYKKFRLVWGVRMEDFTQTLNTRTDQKIINSKTNQVDFLPSANLIFSISSKKNLRLSYSKTLNRPEFRELAPFGFYDFTNRFFTQGNPDLVRATVQNYDIRYEFYPGKGQLFSVSYFLKKFKNPIEIIQQSLNRTLTYGNANSAKSSGIEIEFRTLLSSIFNAESMVLLDDLTLFSNLAIIKSNADVSNINYANPEKSRPMQGQSPYVFNAGIQYANKDNGWIVSTNINRVGNRIVFGSSEIEPSLWEKSRTFLDVQIAKSFYKNKMELKLNIQNILAQDQIFYQNIYTEDVPQSSSITNLSNLIFTGDPLNEDGYDPKTDDVILRNKFGRVISLSMTYNF
jgi:outer membrane receptor protein involved in Fe transport